MNGENSMKQQVEETIATFAYDYMGATPKSVAADIHSHSTLATLHGIIFPVEKDFANSEPKGRGLLEKCYNSLFMCLRQVKTHGRGDLISETS